MSLDFCLNSPSEKITKEGSGIFIRENGVTKEISLAEWGEKFPRCEPVAVRHEYEETNEVFSANITHNLGEMAEQAGIYECLWRPNENGFEKASDIVDRLKTGIELMEASPDVFKEFDADNGWGTYEDFLPWLKNVLTACIENPDAVIEVSV